ncbi:MAG: LamG domain-containing protein [Planctomycetota bacterium]
MNRRPYFSIFLSFALVLCLMWTAFAQAGDRPKTLDTDPNLAGWWKFDETSGIIAADSSKHNRKGFLRESLSFKEDSTSGRISKALKFGRGDGYVQITKYKGVTGTRPRTVATWCRTEETRGEIISWGMDDFGKMFTFGFIRGRIGIRPNGGYLYINEETDDDRWHHVAAVVEEAELPNLHDDVKLYLDGEPAEIHDIGLLDLWPIDTGKDLDVTIGDGFKGIIDDVRLYNRALSEDEINAIFKLQSNKPLPKSK